MGNEQVKEKKKPVSKGVRCGLSFSVSRIDKKLRAAKIFKQVSGSTSVFVTGLVEHTMLEILKRAGEQAKGSKSKRILTHHAIEAVRTDPDLARLFAGFAFTSAGDVPRAIDKILPLNEQKERLEKKKKKHQVAPAAEPEVANNLVDD